jgi:hypothetical protein
MRFLCHLFVIEMTARLGVGAVLSSLTIESNLNIMVGETQKIENTI